jgi:hypothetical protein
MADLVALIVGIAHYPDLPDTWHVQQDRTAKDAIAVTEALVARGADPKKIKLLLSMKAERPADVAGVVPENPDKEILEDFIRKQLGKKAPFVGSQFLFFCSGHGASAEKQAETLIITSDSFAAEVNKRVFNCLGIEQLRTQLQGMPQFSDQLFCVNACRTPAEWAITGDDEVEPIATLALQRASMVSQARFFAAGELEPSPVEGISPDGFSNGFAEALVNCIREGEWPPRAGDWELRLRNKWPATWSDGVHGPDRFLFTRLYDARHQIDRQRQHKLVQAALDRARTWNERRGADPGDLWRTTLIDLHACTADCLDLLMTNLENIIFTDKIVAGGVQRVAQWPRHDQDAGRREKELIGEVSYCLAEDRDLTDSGNIVEAVAALAPGMRVVYVEIDGPCKTEDEGLINAMIRFWQGIIAEAHKRGTRVPCLPLLLVGHVDPDPRADAPPLIDATRFYHPDVLAEGHERRLNLVAGNHLLTWIKGIVPDGDLRRPDLEMEIARALGGRVLDGIGPVRMGKIIEVVDERARPRRQ